jgi:thiamine-monophosphate kinase
MTAETQGRPSETLGDWGEFRLLRDVVLPILSPVSTESGLGDDCAFLRLPGADRWLVVTADAAPKPLASQFNGPTYWSWGWYSVAINASDLASAGADPLGFVSSVEAPSTTLVSEFRDFFLGVRDACTELGLVNLGGNIRQAGKFACHAAAIGTVVGGAPISRRGCRAGDPIVVLGPCGEFAAAYLAALHDGLSALPVEQANSLFRPVPRLREMTTLRKAGLVRSASDNSDGLLGALLNIAERSSCAIEFDLRDELVPPSVRRAASRVNTDPWNLMCCWGDWNVAAAIRKENFPEFERIAKESSIEYRVLGRAVEGEPAVLGRRHGRQAPMNILRNENFVVSSYNADTDEHIHDMLYGPLFRSE